MRKRDDQALKMMRDSDTHSIHDSNASDGAGAGGIRASGAEQGGARQPRTRYARLEFFLGMVNAVRKV